MVNLHARFEWDIAKAEINMRKHRVLFEDATAVFADPRCAIIDTIRAEDGGSRSKATGLIDGRLFTVVFVMRGNICRLISARRSNAKEERDYASADDRLEQSPQDES